MKNSKPVLFALIFLWLFLMHCHSQRSIRQQITLNENWKSILCDSSNAHRSFQDIELDDSHWTRLDIPHNYDQYEGLRRLKHGNLHGSAWYRKHFRIDKIDKTKRYFLQFEGVGSYATIFLNGKQVGYHAGGRTSFTIDITPFLNSSSGHQILAVKADHPAMIRNLPWVCGGCTTESGFSEGSQPLGIFRPVQLIVTHPIRIEPFGIHIWNDTTVSEHKAQLNIQTQLKNYSSKEENIEIISMLIDKKGIEIAKCNTLVHSQAGQSQSVKQILTATHIQLWSLENPYLYRLVTEVRKRSKVIDVDTTLYGIRWISWPIYRKDDDKRFFLNGKPVFINGIAEYEHNMGNSHAFSSEQIKARIAQIHSAGFNAFRDAHQPHNLAYQANWDSLGLLWWPQFSAHIWFDQQDFKDNFKSLLRDWIRERRNSPSIILWGLQNESSLPTDFAAECCALIREMDPTCSSQRLITTCNGGSGTDWDVVQNWSGTYGGNHPRNYAYEISNQLLNGEYGAWRNTDLHSEGSFKWKGDISEDRMSLLMESKIRLAESVKDSCCGQFHWLFASHENPGRTQSGEGFRDIDRIGPVNYKGLFTLWGEPLDAYYMFRSNYVSGCTSPMVYIASHSWPNRWTNPGIKDSIVVFSNCEEVELMNDINGESLQRIKKNGIGTHFLFNQIHIRYNTLLAIGYINGKEAARDLIVLHHLPNPPHFNQLFEPFVAPPQTPGKVVCRVNCGGPDYTDMEGNIWMADTHKEGLNSWGSLSWTDDFEGLPAFYGSQRRSFDPVHGTRDWPLYQSFRYGQQKLKYQFPMKNGKYSVQLHFIEPWYGTGGSLNCEGWRVFDVAVNGKIILDDLDIWKEVGHDHALIKTSVVEVTNGMLEISFPQIKAGQAIVSAIAIYSSEANAMTIPSSPKNATVISSDNHANVQSWLDLGDQLHVDCPIEISELPPALFSAEWIKTRINSNFTPAYAVLLSKESDLYIALHPNMELPLWMSDFADAQASLTAMSTHSIHYKLFVKRVPGKFQISIPTGECMDGSAPWLVLAQPANQLPQAIDQRPVVNYRNESAFCKGTGMTGSYRNRRFVKLGPSDHQSITWKISTGLAGLYQLQIRYFHQQKEPVKGRLILKSQDGLMMMDQFVEFKPMKEDQTWRGLHADTHHTINAGEYSLTIELPGLNDEVCIGDLDVQ